MTVVDFILKAHPVRLEDFSLTAGWLFPIVKFVDVKI